MCSVAGAAAATRGSTASSPEAGCGATQVGSICTEKRSQGREDVFTAGAAAVAGATSIGRLVAGAAPREAGRGHGVCRCAAGCVAEVMWVGTGQAIGGWRRLNA